jgi:hypothetical protein
MSQFEIIDGVAVIPEGTQHIATHAFKDCTELERVVLPEGIKTIGSGAFRGCSSLNSIELPEGLEKIDSRAFKGCSSLRCIHIPASVTTLEWGLLEDCVSMESITVAEGNEILDSRDGCNAIIRTKTNALLAGCKSTVIPSSVTYIAVTAFAGCTGLTDIVIPDSVHTISAAAFQGCTGLTKICIPASVTTLEVHNPYCAETLYHPFNGCENLVSITVDEDNPSYDSPAGSNAIISNSSLLLVGCKTTVIPETVQLIGTGAFARMPIEEITLPDSVKAICTAAFFQCQNLKKINLSKQLSLIEGHDRRNNKHAAFYNCVNLESLELPASLSGIGDLAFWNCKKLESIVVPAGVDYIGEAPFRGCDSLTSLVVEDGNPKYDSRDNCNAVIETKENALVAACNLTVIPESVTEIRNYAFSCCNKITDITIHEGVTLFGRGVFADCEVLKSISLLGPIKDAGNPFYSCRALETITLGPGIKKFAEFMFDDNPVLKTIYVPAKKTAYYQKRLPESAHSLIVEMEPVKKAKK